MKRIDCNYKAIKPYLEGVSKEVFQVSLVTYLLLLLAETLKTGFVSFFFNMNILLVVVLVSGIIMALTESGNGEKRVKSVVTGPVKMGQKDSIYVILVSLGGALLTYYKTQELGWISLVIALITYILVWLLSYLIYTEDNN